MSCDYVVVARRGIVSGEPEPWIVRAEAHENEQVRRVAAFVREPHSRRGARLPLGPRLGPGLVDALPPARDVAVGRHHACALTTTGDVYCWGQQTGG